MSDDLDETFDWLKSIPNLLWDVPEEELRESLESFCNDEPDPNEEAYRDD